MYFKLLPDINYDVKPVSYPFTSSDFVIAKNFFRRFELDPDVYGYALYYNKYAVNEGERLDQVSRKAYGRSDYDWIIVLVNNLINPTFDWPLSENALRKYCEGKYDDPYSEILYYETDELKSAQSVRSDLTLKNIPVVVQEAGKRVSEKFHNGSFTYWNGTQTETVLGSSISHAVTAFEHESKENEKKREIYLLKEQYISSIIKEFRKKNNYLKSSDFVNSRLKKTGV